MYENPVVVFRQVAPLCVRQLMKVKSTDAFRTTRHSRLEYANQYAAVLKMWLIRSTSKTRTHQEVR